MILNQISLEFKWHKLFLGLHSHLKISKLSQVINILYSSTLVLLRGTGPKITQAWTIFSFIQAQTKLHYGATQQQGISESVNSSPFRHKLKLFRKIITTEKIYSASLKGYIHIFHTFSSVQLKDWNKSSKKHFMCFHCSLAKTTVKFSQNSKKFQKISALLTGYHMDIHLTSICIGLRLLLKNQQSIWCENHRSAHILYILYHFIANLSLQSIYSVKWLQLPIDTLVPVTSVNMD